MDLMPLVPLWCRAMQRMGFIPAAYHLAIHSKQGLTMKDIGVVQPWC